MATARSIGSLAIKNADKIGAHDDCCCEPPSCGCVSYGNGCTECFSDNKTPSQVQIDFTGIKRCSDDSDFTEINRTFCLSYVNGCFFESLQNNTGYQVRYYMDLSGSTCVSMVNDDLTEIYFYFSTASTCVKSGSSSFVQGDCESSTGSACGWAPFDTVKGYGGSFTVTTLDPCADCCGDSCATIPEFLDVAFSGVSDCGTHFDNCHATDLNGNTYTVEYTGEGFITSNHLVIDYSIPPVLSFSVNGMAGCVWNVETGSCGSGPSQGPLKISVHMQITTQEPPWGRHWEVGAWFRTSEAFFYGEHSEAGPIADCDFCDVTLPAVVNNLTDNSTWRCNKFQQGLGGTATVSEAP